MAVSIIVGVDSLKKSAPIVKGKCNFAEQVFYLKFCISSLFDFKKGRVSFCMEEEEEGMGGGGVTGEWTETFLDIKRTLFSFFFDCGHRRRGSACFVAGREGGVGFRGGLDHFLSKAFLFL